MTVRGGVGEEELRAWHGVADVYVHASPNEMFGLSVLEALASGLPVVASSGGAAREVLDGAALYFHPRDHVGLSERIVQLSADEDLRRTFSRKARRRALRFSWDRVAGQYLALYAELIG